MLRRSELIKLITHSYSGGRWLRGYIQGKLSADPVFDAGLQAVRNQQGPVIDLGCGQGFTCRWAREMGAILAHGIDISEKMLDSAKHYPSDPAIKYEHSDLETIVLPLKSYNLIVSSLALHYVEHLPSVIA